MSVAVPGLLAAALVAALRLALAFILAEAALHALRDRAMFAAIIEEYRIVPARAAAFVGVCVPLGELACAVALLTPAAKLGAIGAAGLFGGFAGAMGVNLLRGRVEISCGCGGGNSQPIGWALIGRNALLIIASVAVMLAPAGFGARDVWAPELGFAAFLTVLYFAVNQLIGNARALSMVRA